MFKATTKSAPFIKIGGFKVLSPANESSKYYGVKTTQFNAFLHRGSEAFLIRNLRMVKGILHPPVTKIGKFYQTVVSTNRDSAMVIYNAVKEACENGQMPFDISLSDDVQEATKNLIYKPDDVRRLIPEVLDFIPR